MTLKTLAIVCGLALIVGIAAVPQAQADTVTFDAGTIALHGTWTGGDIADISQVNVVSNQAQIASISGGLANYLSVGDFVTYSNIPIGDFQSSLDLWTGGGFTFTLTSIQFVNQTKNQVNLEGEGILHGNGISTSATWDFKALKNGQFHNDEGITGVPEPSTLLLLSVGLILVGLGFVVRRPSGIVKS